MLLNIETDNSGRCHHLSYILLKIGVQAVVQGEFGDWFKLYRLKILHLSIIVTLFFDYTVFLLSYFKF